MASHKLCMFPVICLIACTRWRQAMNISIKRCLQRSVPPVARLILMLTSDGLPPRNLRPHRRAVIGEHAQRRRRRSLKEKGLGLFPCKKGMEIKLAGNFERCQNAKLISFPNTY
jgi:hypothetical protein